MARTFIAGGSAGTSRQAGKPFVKRIVRIGGDSGYLREDGMTCEIDGNNDINFKDVFSPDWNAGADGQGGELIMIEFPTTVREAKILLEEAWYNDLTNPTEKLLPGDKGLRCRVAFLAENQDISYDKVTSTLATPISGLNFIEINAGEEATISSRTKVVFVLLQKYTYTTATDLPRIFDSGTSLSQGRAGSADDAAVLLVTAVLDHEPRSGRDY